MFFMAGPRALYDANLCTCSRREHACSPPCRVHPKRGGGLGNPGRIEDIDIFAVSVVSEGGHPFTILSEEEAPTDGGPSNGTDPVGRGA